MLLFCAPAIAADFIDNGDGTVTDNTTNLMWQQGGTPDSLWQESLDYCKALSLAGNTDWRLPNIKELESIVDATTYAPAIDLVYFPYTDVSTYWSSTSIAGRAFHVDFTDGKVTHRNKNDYDFIRCVR